MQLIFKNNMATIKEKLNLDKDVLTDTFNNMLEGDYINLSSRPTGQELRQMQFCDLQNDDKKEPCVIKTEVQDDKHLISVKTECLPEPTMLKVELDSDNEIKDERASEEENEVLMPFKFVPVRSIKEERLDVDNFKLEKKYELATCVDWFDNIPMEGLCNIKAVSSDNSSLANKCDICNKIMHNKKNLERHYRVHTGEKPFKCKFCMKSYFHIGALRAHLRIHTAEKRFFKCDVCGKGFMTKSGIKDHCQQHLTERQKHQCDICDKVFSMPIHLETHYHSHMGGEIYKCRICQ